MNEPSVYSIAADRAAFEQWAHDSQPREPEERAGEPGAAEIVRLLTASKDLRPASLGRHLLLLASVFGVGRAGQLTGNELAKLLGVKKARLSQLKSETAKLFPGFNTLRIRGNAAQLRAAAKLRE